MVGTRGSQEPVCVLIIDNDPVARRLLAAAMHASAAGDVVVREAASLADAEALLHEAAFTAAAVSLDFDNGESPIAALRRAGLAGPIVATSSRGSVSVAVEAMRAGADDFLVKPYQPAELVRRLFDRIGRTAPLSISVRPRESGDPRLYARLLDSRFRGNEREIGIASFHHFIGASPAMLALYEQIKRVAPSKAPVFITGESGSGKEVCAEAVHACSGRAHAPFIAINCSAIPRELMESEIFGHVKGAFTGAHEDRPGAAELAHGGTLFLDEICEMDLALQAKLLRFVQTGAVRRVGDTRLRHIDVRFVCATNREPGREIEAGRFREDLYYRLHVLPLRLPALRERGEDIVLLARTFLARYADEEGRGFRGFTPEAESALASHAWPGNVRELQNVIRRVVVLHDGEEVSAEMLALSSTHEAARDTGPLPSIDSPSIAPFWREEERIIRNALAAFDGNAQRAASALQISPSTIYRKLQAWSRAQRQRRGAA
ncbi:MAG: sigma-54-dependent Fis family transcriptional regulator [Bradyrhizobiaceae bacterium]|nr:sigma-54-dependent Fis family transcriptional regulator [Bradyrhizobiaceae bacterium]